MQNTGSIKDKRQSEAAERLQSTQLADCADRLSIFAHDVRLQVIVALLKSGGSTVSELLEIIKVEQNLLSHHLGLMRNAGLVIATREGKHMRYTLADGMLTEEQMINLGCCQIHLGSL